MTGENGKPHWMRILEHLGKYDPDNYIITAPFCLTQDGIGESVGISRAHSSLILKDLYSKGLVEKTLMHTNGSKRRRQIYFPTYTAIEILKGLKQ